jgi:hypothetical protein
MSPRAAKQKPPVEPDALVREKAGRYRSGDERFAVRQDGGEWFVTDSQQTNEFGLEMVLGPFGTIALAREAMASQREHPAGSQPGATILPLPRAARKPEAAKKPETAKKTEAAKKSETAEKPEAPKKPEPPREPEPPPVEYGPAAWTATSDERDQVARTVRTINDAWTSGHPEHMKDALDENVVFVQPGFAGREVGRDRAIQSYAEFGTSATLHRYVESDLTIDLAGHTAVAGYAWEIDYTMKRRRHHETGRDLFVFDRAGTRWKVVWRLVLPDPDE